MTLFWIIAAGLMLLALGFAALPLLRSGRQARFLFLPDGEDPGAAGLTCGRTRSPSA